MFAYKTGKIADYTAYKMSDPQTGEYVVIVPGFGGNVSELVLQKKGELFSIIDGITPEDIASGNKTYKSTQLVPFPNRIAKGRYTFNGKSYQLPINHGPNAIHGLLMSNPLEIVSINLTPRQASMELQFDYDGSQPGYPFKFRCLIKYTLSKGRGLLFKTTVKNVDSQPLPVGDSWHPYYKTRGKIDKLQMKLPAAYRVEDVDLIPTGKLIKEDFSSAFDIGSKFYDTGYALTEKPGRAATEIYDPELDIKLMIWQETGKGEYNYMQVYTPPHRNSIAVEPMSCCTNAFNTQKGLVVLEPGQSWTGSFGVYLK